MQFDGSESRLIRSSAYSLKAGEDKSPTGPNQALLLRYPEVLNWLEFSCGKDASSLHLVSWPTSLSFLSAGICKLGEDNFRNQNCTLENTQNVSSR